MIVPSPWIALLLSAASYRIWRLLAEDTILDRPRRWIVKLPRRWREGMPIPSEYRSDLAQFINCPWCFGWWIALSVWALWEANHHWTEIVAVPFAISAAVGIIRSQLDPPE